MYTIRKEPQPTRRQANPKTHAELGILLTALDEALPQLIAQNPDGADFMPLFADRADSIARQTEVADLEWLMSRIEALLEKHGRRDEQYLPPHDPSIA